MPLPKTSKHTIVFVLLMGCITFGGYMLWSLWTGAYTSKGQLTAWVFDIGQGSAAFITLPNGKQVLIDGGPDALLLSKVGSVLSPWDRTIDLVLASHPDTDHIAGFIPLARAYTIQRFGDPGVFSGIPLEDTLLEQLSMGQVSVEQLKAGDVFVEGEVELRILSPSQEELGESETNTRSLVVDVHYKDIDILFTGDAPSRVEERLIQQGLGEVDVLIVGHHGSISSTSTTFLQHIQPAWAIISSGEGNAFGHPHPVVLERLEAVGARVLRTDQQSDIRLVTDGESVDVGPRPLPF